MEDITPKLIEQIHSEFNRQYVKSVTSGRLKTISNRITNKTATYADAYKTANEIGNIRAKVLKNVLSSEVLPDGKMYFNIADKVVRDSLETDYEIISNVCESVQKIANDKAKIGLKVQVPELDEERIKGFIDRISSENIYDDVAWILQEPVKTFDRKVVDDSVKKNTDFQYSAGVRTKIIRTADAKCCDWCASLEGEYYYPGVPGEVFMRHDNCRCEIEYGAEKLNAYNRNFMR